MSALRSHVRAFRALSAALGAQAKAEGSRSLPRRVLGGLATAISEAADDLDQQIRDDALRLTSGPES